jgi:DNA-binding HxlR family transcriptional regulator
LSDKRLVLGKETLKIVKALANENRFKILTQLYVEPITFQKLKEVTKLEKSALANNLNKLLDVGLVEKSQHGIYAITEDGKKLLEALAAFIKGSNERKRKLQIAQAQRQMMKPFLERHTRDTRG